jgi:hypothetical protein
MGWQEQRGDHPEGRLDRTGNSHQEWSRDLEVGPVFENKRLCSKKPPCLPGTTGRFGRLPPSEESAKPDFMPNQFHRENLIRNRAENILYSIDPIHKRRKGLYVRAWPAETFNNLEEKTLSA